MKNKKIIIIGAGLSGLAAAVTFKKSGIHALMIDQQPAVGGRVKTHSINGFIIDEGFQVLLSTYPELNNFVDLKQLNLKMFKSGAMIFNGHKMELLANPLKHPFSVLKTLFSSIANFKDQLLVIKLLLTCRFFENSFQGKGLTTKLFLNHFGFSKKFIEQFWEPFLTGIYLDSKLTMDSNYFIFLMKHFSRGGVGLPSQGMAELPLQISKQLDPSRLLLNKKIKSWTENEVVLDNQEVLKADYVICAYNNLNDNKNSQETSHFYSVTTLYFESESLNELPWGGWLILIPASLGYLIDHLTILTSVSSSYSSSSKQLLSVSLIGDKKFTIEQIISEIQKFANKNIDLKHIHTVQIEKALPKMEKELNGFKIMNGVYYCGDHLSTPSINGALKSGRLVAESILKEIV